MKSSNSLRGFRMEKDKEKGQTSMLRYIRQAPTNPRHILNSKYNQQNDSEPTQSSADSTTPDTTDSQSSPKLKKSEHPKFVLVRDRYKSKPIAINVNNNSSKLVPFSTPPSRPFIIQGSSSTSPNRLDIQPPIPIASKLFYVKPAEDKNVEENTSDAKESGFDISPVLKEKPMTLSNGNHSDDSNSEFPLNENSENDKIQYNKRLRIESDDEENGIIKPVKRPCLSDDESCDSAAVGEENANGPKKKFSPEMIEKLLDTYTELYPTIERMELFETMEKWEYNFSEMTKELDMMVKEQKQRMKEKNRAIELEEKRKARLEERERLKKKKQAEMQKKKVIWKMKARFHEQEQEDEEEDDYIGNSRVYESDSSECEGEYVDEEEVVSPARTMVLEFFNESSSIEMSSLPGCSKKKAEVIISYRPFENWRDLVHKFKMGKHISTDLLNGAKDVLQMRNAIKNLMKKCEKISSEIQSFVSDIINGEETSSMNEQPKILNPEMKLKNYQLIGLNWLVLMHDQRLNGVLADEMGLGKTVQAISFLAYLKEKGELEDKMCLIVVPTSTLDNWARELSVWLPSVGYMIYHGSQEERKGMRMEILNEELEDDIGIILTTYNMVTSSAEDKSLFKRLRLHTVIYDEAHMLKNMTSQRYENLMKIRCYRRLLLTGTPLQNNLVELMSILIFVMPQLFEGRKEELKKVFSMFPKNETDENKGRYESERIQQAKRIMAPFFLRRLKEDVLKDLPSKSDEVYHVPMSKRQEIMYKNTVKVLSKRAEEMKEELEKLKLQDLEELSELQVNPTTSKNAKKIQPAEDSSSNMLMKLRKLANHPLLLRNLYTDAKIKEMSKLLKNSTHKESILDYIVEDFSVMSDFEIHQTCQSLDPISKYKLSDELIVESGKLEKLDEMLPSMKTNGDRVLIFSQFVIVLNILEEYMKIRGYEYRRLDGSTLVSERQEKIDDFNEDEKIFVFLLSTRAGGLGINLCTANTVILHDIDFNPYNDRQAEDRCHRVGQTRDVKVYRFISKNSIEEGMYQIACSKLQLEKDVTGKNEDHRKSDVVALLKTALRVNSSE